MNTTYLICMLILIAVSVWGWLNVNEIGEEFLVFCSTLFGSVASFIMFIVSFLPVGAPVLTDSVPFQIEKTEYRIIVKVGGNEYQYKDAETVAKVAQIKSVNLVQSRDAWGGNVGKPCVVLIFKESK